MQKKVLIVDDIPVNCKIVAMHLNKMGVQTEMAPSGQAAVVACMQNHYDLIIMDLDMPEIDGFLAAKFIRLHEKAKGTRTPILAMSAHDHPHDIRQCIAVGMDGFLAKGISGEQLQQIIQAYCSDDVDGSFAIYSENKHDEKGFEDELRQLRSRFAEDSAEIVAEFAHLELELLPALELAIAQRDTQKLTHVTYTLKGCCSNIGLTSVAQLCMVINDDGYANRWKRVVANYRRLLRMLERLQSKKKSKTNVVGLARVGT